MKTPEEKVLAVLGKPLTNLEIERLTKLEYSNIAKILRKLHTSGGIISRGETSARRHMRLSTAIEILFDEIAKIKRTSDG